VLLETGEPDDMQLASLLEQQSALVGDGDEAELQAVQGVSTNGSESELLRLERLK
jgi:hypothetical protein